MHIEPGVVNGAKIALSYATAAGAATYGAKQVWDSVKASGLGKLAARTVIATAMVFSFFQILPHFPVGVSEVHFILGSTLFLMFGAAPAALALAAGLLLQGVLVAPFDLPQYGMNVTTLLAPLFALQYLAKRLIAPNTAYVDITYKQALALSTAYQGGVVAWVGFWAFYGQGFGVENITAVSAFAASYMLVVVIEPVVDLAVLAAAKALRTTSPIFTSRLHSAA
ncbi:energy-coupling factor ABC transporter permease [Actibacterium pelagium]|uniref:Cobalt transporter n=1 Tax=Actibacterium pelagium TaxID=2029103 RepID=A0A917AN00_9RHOB|nr:energy-coupling factor ABC transporter permease [Actibacterium pelagium]GGE60827.1 cobalt transporter [Actibacterium pelagium]